MRSREPWRLPAGQSRAVPFLQAAVLFAALCIFARSAALVLAAFLAAPVPAAQTLLHLGQQAVESRAAESSAESAAEAASVPPEQETAAPVQTGVERYFVSLQPDEARPADAGTVTEQQFGQGSGEKYIPCGAGSIKNNTRQTAADVAAEAAQPLPFAIEKDSAAPQVLIMHTHATEDYRLSAGLWFTPGDGARSTDRGINMCAVGRVMADTLNAAGICTLHDETLNDYPSYTGSYANSRAVVQQYLAQYPSIKVVLDVPLRPGVHHRRAAGGAGDDHLRVRQRHQRAAARMAAEPAFCRCVGAQHGGKIPRTYPPGAVQLPVL